MCLAEGENSLRALTIYSGFYVLCQPIASLLPRRCLDTAAGFRLRVAWPHYIMTLEDASQYRYTTKSKTLHS